jgi:hypothetical protein
MAYRGEIEEIRLGIHPYCHYAILPHSARSIDKTGFTGKHKRRSYKQCRLYSLVAYACCLFFPKKIILQYVLMGLCVVFIVMAMKRGAILIGAIVVLLFIWSNFRHASYKQKFIVLFVSALLLMCGYMVVDYMLDNSHYFNARLKATEAGKMSGRNKLYPMIWQAFVNEPNLLIQLFGRGANGTLKIAPNYAHSDWLEILTNQGLMGISVFIAYWYCFWFNVKYKVRNIYDKLSLLMILCITFMQTIFSMSISSMEIYLTSVMGFCLAGGFERAEEEEMEDEQNDLEETA